MKRTSFPYKEEFHLISSKGSEYLRYLMRQQTELLMLRLGPFSVFCFCFFHPGRYKELEDVII